MNKKQMIEFLKLFKKGKATLNDLIEKKETKLKTVVLTESKVPGVFRGEARENESYLSEAEKRENVNWKITIVKISRLRPKNIN